MVAMAKNKWDNEDIASNCAAEVCRLVCLMKEITEGSFEPGLHQLSHDVYDLVMKAMEGRDAFMRDNPERN